MSLARNFTTRRPKETPDIGDGVKRSKTLHKTPSQTPLRHKISSPVELVHTTNMLSYNAPDLPRWPRRNDSVSTRPRTRTDSDASTTASGSSTPPTSPETEAYDASHPSKNHLSSYFMVPSAASDMTTSARPAPSHNVQDSVPAIPKRAPSHTKKSSFDALVRKASMSRMSKESDRSDASKPSLSFSRSSSTSTRASTTSASRSSAHHSAKVAPPVPPPAPPLELPIQYPSSNMDLDLPMQQPPAPPKAPSNPFGVELAQVTELAEEITAKGRLDVIYEDEQYLQARGLAKMSADDYLNEIHSVMSQFFPETVSPRPVATVWI